MAGDALDDSFLDSARISEAQPKPIADLLVAVSKDATSLAQLRMVLSYWQQLAPSSQAIRRSLVEGIFLPLLDRGEEEATDLAISFFGLVADVDGVRKEVRERLRAAATTDDLKRRVDERLGEAGWTKKSLFGLGSTKDADD